MRFRELLEKINNNIGRWNHQNIIKAYILIPEFRLVWRYRWLQFYRTHKCLKIMSGIQRILYHNSCVRCGCDIPSHVTIGSGLKILHGFGIVINSRTIIGDNCTIVAGTVIGANHTGQPVIGNDVNIGANCTIVGGIRIGNNVEIGAGSVVTHNVPDNAVIYGEASHIRKIKEV